MGNAAGASGGWFSFSEESTLVLLRLNAAQSVGLLPGEELCGIIKTGPGEPDMARVRAGTPTQLSVGASMTLSVEFQAVRTAGGVNAGGRAMGDIYLPLEHIAQRYGGGLYHMWLPLCSPRNVPSVASFGSNSQTPDEFDQAIWIAARDTRLPMVCVSLCHADWPQATDEIYELGVEPEQKRLRFINLLQSHAQHARLLQALYRQCRSAQRGADASQINPQFRDNMADTWASPTPSRGSYDRDAMGNSSFDCDSPSPNRRGRLCNDVGTSDPPIGQNNSLGQSNEANQLRLEIQSTKREANLRINQASEAIQTLKDRVSAKQAEHENLRKETLRHRQEAERLELENEQLALQLERHAHESGDLCDCEDEVRRLRREEEVLQEQKDALVQILEDLYGTVGKNETRQTRQETHMQEAACEPVEPKRDQTEQTWTHMLPRPSELFSGGLSP